MFAACNVIMVAADEPLALLPARKLDAPKKEGERERERAGERLANGTCVQPSARARTTLARLSPKACRCNLQSSGWSDHLRPVRASLVSVCFSRLLHLALFHQAPSFALSSLLLFEFRSVAACDPRSSYREPRFFFSCSFSPKECFDTRDARGGLMIGLEGSTRMGIRFFGRERCFRAGSPFGWSRMCSFQGYREDWSLDTAFWQIICFLTGIRRAEATYVFAEDVFMYVHGVPLC